MNYVAVKTPEDFVCFHQLLEREEDLTSSTAPAKNTAAKLCQPTLLSLLSLFSLLLLLLLGSWS